MGSAGPPALSPQVAFNIHRPMENSEYFNPLGCSHKIWNPIVAVEYFSNLSVSDWLVPMSDLRLSTQHLCLVKNSVNHLFRGGWIVSRDVCAVLFEAFDRLLSPHYFCHESTRERTSCCVTIRPTSASARPRSTIRAYASSRIISS